MNEIRLIIAEDEKSTVEAYRDNIEAYNDELKKENLRIIAQFYEEAKVSSEKINNNFDAAIIDLKLKDDKSGDESGGQKLINDIVEKLRIPTFVYTANPGLFDAIEREESVFFKKCVKAETKILSILKIIKHIYGTGITRIMGGRGLIEDKLNEIFWKHIDKNLDLEELKTFSEKKLLRYIALHLQEYLGLSESGDFENYIPAEVYIHPPIKNHIHTGDILKKGSDDKFYIILNPSCDMVVRSIKKIDDGKKLPVRNAEKIVLASLIKWSELDDLSGITKESGKDKKKRLKDHISNKKGRYHYLPPYAKLKDGMFIDFQFIGAYDPDTIESNFERVATISSVFLNNIIARFSQYYSRQGQPDFDEQQQVDYLLA